jgi:SPX domain protein involved in polyphosphate accumulation
MNYKLMKKKINDITDEQESERALSGIDPTTASTGASKDPEISKSAAEIEFFRFLMMELRKTSDFFQSSEHLYKIRRSRLMEGLRMLQEKDKRHDKNTWTRLLVACVRFYKDVLLLENYAIMHFCGFSKILKKHDKMTGHNTRDAFMINVMRNQNFVDYPYVLELLKESEALFEEIQGMERYDLS